MGNLTKVKVLLYLRLNHCHRAEQIHMVQGGGNMINALFGISRMEGEEGVVDPLQASFPPIIYRKSHYFPPHF